MLDKIKRWSARRKQRQEVEQAMRKAKRLPPGQRVTLKFPVLHIGQVPAFDPATWKFRIWGAVAKPVQFSWTEFQTLPRQTPTLDLHCVTQWSKFDTVWEGVSLRTLIENGIISPNSDATQCDSGCGGGLQNQFTAFYRPPG